MTRKNHVAGTIMVTNQQGESFFLVNHDEGKFYFPFEKIDTENQSPMGIIMNILLQHVTFDSDSLRLMDLTNIKEENSSTPLYVFDMVESPVNPDTLLKNSDVMFWRRAKELTYLLEECVFDGVPIYHHEPQVEVD